MRAAPEAAPAASQARLLSAAPVASAAEGAQVRMAPAARADSAEAVAPVVPTTAARADSEAAAGLPTEPADSEAAVPEVDAMAIPSREDRAASAAVVVDTSSTAVSARTLWAASPVATAEARVV